MLGNKKEDEKILTGGKEGYTMKVEIWNKRASLASIEESKVKWMPSVHPLNKDYILHVTGGSY